MKTPSYIKINNDIIIIGKAKNINNQTYYNMKRFIGKNIMNARTIVFI